VNEESFRRSLLELLDMGSAHITLEQAISELDTADAFRRPVDSQAGADGLRSAWELLEHMRTGQEDILNYTLDSTWRSPPWPEGYWPSRPANLTPPERERLWRSTLDGFRADLQRVRDLVTDSSIDLTDEIPHGEGRTYLRQVLLVADHNAYHLGQIVSVRRVLGVW
jgi:uncharacterized damage-inducible protein DinB